jgi:hypothetical protein
VGGSPSKQKRAALKTPGSAVSLPARETTRSVGMIVGIDLGTTNSLIDDASALHDG